MQLQSPTASPAVTMSEPAASQRGPPHMPGQYEFAFAVTGTVDVEDASTKQSACYYPYEVKITRLGKVSRFPSDAATASLFQKRWSEIDAWDEEWKKTIGVDEHGKNALHEEIGLKKSEKFSAPFRSKQAVREARTALLTKYIHDCMSSPALHRSLSKFLGVPLNILAPPTKEELAAADAAATPTGPRPSTVDPPLSYTKRKIKARPKRAEPEVEEEYEEEAVVPNAASSPAPAAASGSHASSAAGHGAAAGASSSAAAAACSSVASPSAHRVPTQYKQDGSTPNPNWHGPSLVEWARLDAGVELLKLPHSTGMFSGAKTRRFRLLSFDSPDAQAKLAKAKETKAGKYLSYISPRSFLLLWSSSKSDVLDTFFVLGDPDLPWQATFDQSGEEGQFVRGKQKQPWHTEEQARVSFTVRYRDGMALKTVDVVAPSKEDFELWVRALTYVRWRETGLCAAEPPPASERAAVVAAVQLSPKKAAH
jgi:hypothetical protein